MSIRCQVQPRVSLLVLAVFATCGTAFGQPTLGNWQGVEILGNRITKREDIEKIVAIQVGSGASVSETSALKARCLEAKDKLSLADAKCGFVMLPGGKVYFTVDVIEKGEERRLAFRDPKSFRKEVLPPELSRLVGEYQALRFAKFQKGTKVEEFVAGEVLDSNDTELHLIAEKLASIVPSNREQVFRVLEYSDDQKLRATAATLLNWAGEPRLSIAALPPFLDDPSEVVRNDISRFILKFIDLVGSEIAVSQLIDAFSRQLDFPSHGDRNKALYALSEIAKNKPASRPVIRKLASPAIAYIAENSILVNVGGEAKKLQVLLKESQDK